MIGRFRDRGITRETVVTSIAGGFIGLCWLMRYVNPHPELETGLALVAVGLTGIPIIYQAIRGLLAWRVNVDELVSLAIVASLLIGEFLTAATVGFIMVLGSLLESYTSSRARRAIESLIELVPETARVIRENGECLIPVEQVQVGQLILIKPGEKVPIDGKIIEGTASVNQAPITGEPLPVDVGPGGQVFAGSFVLSGALTVEATRVGSHSTLGKIVSLIEEAESHQAPIVRSADAFAKWFTPSIVTLAGIVWYVSGELIRGVSVLVVGCPCALILATPTAIVAAMGVAAKRGLMVKGGRYLEAVADVDAIAFDKTGTLTVGSPSVRDVVTFNGADGSQVLSWAASVEQKSEHPLAQTIVREAVQRGLPIDTVTDFVSDIGLGVRGTVQNDRISVGRNRYGYADASNELQDESGTVLWVSRNDGCVGAIVLDDRPRESAIAAVQELKDLGIQSLHILSGDRCQAVERLAESVRIDSWNAELFPHEKVSFLDDLKNKGQKVMYVGDGVNDGPALAASYVGVAMGAGASPLALETSDVGVLSDDILLIPALIRLGRITKRRVYQNLLFFAVIFNGVALLLASSGVLTPIAAAVTHNIGSIAVVLNSARLARWKG